MTTRTLGRRELLCLVAATMPGLVLPLASACRRQTAEQESDQERADVVVPAPAAPSAVAGPRALQPWPPTIAVSLDRLQDDARAERRRGKPVGRPLDELAGINRWTAYMFEPSAGPVLLGNHDPDWPATTLDDLAVALRHAYGVGEARGHAGLGVTIDPAHGESDPWAIQTVGTFGFGLPPGATRGPAMCQRFIAIDHRLKFYSAGIYRVGDVPDVIQLSRAADPFCADTASARALQVRDRYWFTPDVPTGAARFREDADVLLVDRPTGVKVEARQQLAGAGGREIEASAASPVAGAFAKRFTADVLEPMSTTEAVHIVSDFRLIELTRVMRFRGVPPDRLGYLLGEHEVALVPVPSHIGGVYRDENSRVTCRAVVTERDEGRHRRISVQQEQQSRQIGFRGGVDADVPIQEPHFTRDRTGQLATLRSCVLASRPSPTATWWPLRCGKSLS
jgi:hypothetical protein